MPKIIYTWGYCSIMLDYFGMSIMSVIRLLEREDPMLADGQRDKGFQPKIYTNNMLYILNWVLHYL